MRWLRCAVRTLSARSGAKGKKKTKKQKGGGKKIMKAKKEKKKKKMARGNPGLTSSNKGNPSSEERSELAGRAGVGAVEGDDHFDGKTQS